MSYKNKSTVTIGIPAFNEAANIGHLLRDILLQNDDQFHLEKILVISDGSRDATAATARAVSDPRIEVRDERKREGKAARCNEILRATQTDILVLMDADVRPLDKQYVENLILPIQTGRADITSGRLKGARPSTLVGRILSNALLVKEYLFSQWNNGRNIYTCRGATIAFGRRFYAAYMFPRSIGNDTHVYLFGTFYKYRYVYLSRVALQIKLPETLEDYIKQSTRFVQSKSRFITEFPRRFIRREYAIPWVAYAKTLVFALRSRPDLLLLYVGMIWIARFRSYLDQPVPERWDIAVSSKEHAP